MEVSSAVAQEVPGIQTGVCGVDTCCGLGLRSGGSDQERTKKKRRGDRYSVQTSLIVATLKKMLPIGLNMCAPTDQELITLAKTRYALKDTDEEVREFLHNNLHLQGKVEGSPSLRWQMALYWGVPGREEDADDPEKIVRRVQEVSAVLYHLDQTEHPHKSKKAVWHKLLSKQRRRAVVACFRMTPLYNLPTHRACNMFLESYKAAWILTEDHSFEDRMIDDLSKAGEQEEEEEEVEEKKPDPLHQLVLHFSRTALTEKSKLDEDYLYMAYADIMAKVSPHTSPGAGFPLPTCSACPQKGLGWYGGVCFVHPLTDAPSPELPPGGGRGERRR
ncbi:Ryanodine receptor 1 [Saguinus oedipus]|uniref:Ryanodine receptor 1 n=1 Tax=Saguinus oedipus TaxID=9490 RepID=A0ABQ9TUA3_SAGOE|nr:Ryanodine receptor 1 [Saguinus oedipus]